MWRGPRTVTSATSDWIAWRTPGDLHAQDFKQVQSTRKLTSVSVNLSGSTSSVDDNPPTGTEVRDQMKITRTAPLICANFGFAVSGTIKGIELEIVGQRFNRVVDWDIRLWNGAKLGNNRAIKIEFDDEQQPNSVPNTQRYGSSTDAWGAELTAGIVNSVDFGVSIEFASHPITPCAETAYIDSVLLRVFT